LNKPNAEQQQAVATTPLAIVGIGSLFPEAANAGVFWRNIRKGVDAITEVPESHWRSDEYFDADPKCPDKVYARCGGFLAPVDFEPMKYGILPNALEAIDTSQLLGLVAVEQALADAGYADGREFDRERVSVVLGVTGTLELVVPLGARLGHPRWREALRDAGIADELAEDVVQRISDSYVPWQENSFPGLLGNVVAGRISKHFDFGGTNCVVDAACGSSLGAINLAAMELATGKADMVVSGGIDTFNDIFMYTCFSKTPALSPSGHARPFDSDADGTTLGEGLGIVVLKRLADAQRDGDRIYAVIKSIGSSSDGSDSAIYEPSAAGQQKAVRRAYAQAGVEPRTVELIEAHGTGTRVGDAVEVNGLRAVFGDAETPWCALGSIKSQIGHTKAAAGSAGLIKTALALYHRTLPPTIKVERPQEVVTAAGSPFYVNTEPRPWVPHGDYPRRAGVSALGFGGSNFHCLLEEYGSAKAGTDWLGETQIAAFSAADAAGLRAALKEFPAGAAWPLQRRAAAASRAAFDAQQGCRLLLVFERDDGDLAARLQSLSGLLESRSDESSWSTPDGSFFARGEGGGRLAMLFPGQGAQYPGMLRDLAVQFPQFLDAFIAADSAFAANAGTTLGQLTDLVYPQPRFDDAARSEDAARLRATEVAQPALGAVSLAARALLDWFGVRGAAFAGHSYGELSALCSADSFDAATLHALSRLRGELMAAGEGDRGSMLAVSAPLAEVEAFLAESGLQLVLANRNTPSQGVLSGATAEIDRAAVLLKEKGLRATRLTVSAAFHSELVAEASGPFGERLQQIAFSAPKQPVFANSSGARYPAETDAARELLAGQLASPVEFVDEIEAIFAAGCTTFVEVGPGARLSGMVKAILAGREHQAIALDASNGKRSGIVDLARALAQLAALGHPVELARWDAGQMAVEEPASGKKKLTVPLCGANYFKAPQKRPAREAQVAESAAPQAPQAVAAAATPLDGVRQDALQDTLQLTRQSMQALQQLQEQTARLHQQYLAGQEAATRSFAGLVEQQNRLLQGQPLAALPAAAPLVAPPTVAATAVAPTADPAVAAASVEAAAPVAAPIAEAAATPAPAPSPAVDADRVAAVLLAVVAEKTGYPQEMLELEMTLDGDLGIDSIKRVEILSALQQQLPEAPAVQPDQMGSLQTLGQIIDHLAVVMPAAAAPAAPAAAVVGDAAAGPVLDSDRVATLLLAVVAEKTGYPQEMLELEMTLDGDLGIDSIKRVEILSALQQQLPEAPAVQPDQVGSLQTLAQIIDHLAAGSSDQVAESREAGGLDRSVVAETLLSVIAGKTGYPQEMLELEMSLDSDLGIDSIKRVEILSALQEQLPEAPAIKPEHLGTLQTVGQIVDFLASVSGAPAVPPAVERELPAVGTGVERQRLQLVELSSQSDGEPLRLSAEAPLWITDDGNGLADALCAELIAAGLNAGKVAIDALEPVDELAGLVLLTPARGTDEAFLGQAFQLLQHAEAALLKAAGRGDAVLATVSRLNGRFGLNAAGAPAESLADPLSAGLAGLAKTAGHEWADVTCRAFDLPANDAAQALAERLAAELLVDGPQELGLDAAGRHTLELVSEALAAGAGAGPLAAGDLVVVSGGARGVTAEVAVALAAASHASLLLLGRSELPSSDEPAWLRGLNDEAEIKKALIEHAATPLKPAAVGRRCHELLAQREVRRTLQRIEQAGGQASYRSVDLRDAAAVAAAIDNARAAHGPLRGLVHGAGVLADRLIRDKTLEQFESVCSTKISGLQNLLAAVGDDELKAMVIFSSSTARFGRTGQVDYAVANEVLNKLAQQQAALRPGCRVLSLNWGPWDGGMVTPALKKVFAEEGISVIGLAAGADYLVDELATPPGGPVELVILGGRQVVVDRTVNEDNPCVSRAFDLELSIDQFPFLESHVIDGKAVLPVAVMVEWLAHGAIHNNPGLRFHGFNDLRVLKGVRLARGEQHTLQVMTGKAFKSDGVHVVPVELCGIDPAGQHLVHARARIVLAAKLPEAKPAAARGELASYSRPIEEIYQPDRLFHGPILHGIRELIGCSDDAIASLVRPAPSPIEWVKQPLRTTWLADPLALDSSFQMMILWSYERYQCGSLPVFAGRFRQYRERFPESGVEIRVRITRQSASNAVAEIDFVDPANGALVARIEDYECVIDASLNASFQRNKLQGAA
jgi:acyl transferase domain-containing protein